jgi:DNA-binding IclR family transcriptional regulator
LTVKRKPTTPFSTQSSNVATTPRKPSAPAKSTDRQYVTALARGLSVLRCFSPAQPSLGTTEIARMTGLAQATVWRLCHTLISEGYLVQAERHDKLRPGLPVLALGYAAISNLSLAKLVETELEAFAKRHNIVVSVTARDGESMVYIQRCHGSEIVLRDLTVGSRIPLIASVAGWAWLAGLTEAQRQAVFKELKRADPTAFGQMRPKMTQALAAYAETGYVINKGLLNPRINAVGVPFVSPDGRTALSLVSGGLNQIFDDTMLKRVGEELQALRSRLVPALTVGST